jgi:hypothetical protein
MWPNFFFSWESWCFHIPARGRISYLKKVYQPGIPKVHFYPLKFNILRAMISKIGSELLLLINMVLFLN